MGGCEYQIVSQSELSKTQDEIASLKKNTLDNQEKCAKQAKSFFADLKLDNDTHDFENHYNLKLNKCFVLVSKYVAKIDDFASKDLYDAFEQKNYASWAWKSKEDKKYWEVKPFICTMLDAYCQSTEEFDAFVKTYMEE